MQPSITLDFFEYLVKVRRPAYGAGVKRMQSIIQAVTGWSPDKHGNIIAEVRHPDNSRSDTLFSCHIDTACHDEGNIDLVMIENYLMTSTASILGADDAAGIFIMLNMIVNNVPGTYVFHEAEEIGGVGSSAIADNQPDFLSRFSRAIAFDRAGTTDIITQQMTGTCCSNKFAEQLAKDLRDASCNAINMQPTSGIFTDTANYIDYIPECTNISVGYYDEHTYNETQDIDFLITLTTTVLRIDWDKLPVVRKIGKVNDEEVLQMQSLIELNPKGVAQFLLEYGFDHYEVGYYLAGDNY